MTLHKEGTPSLIIAFSFAAAMFAIVHFMHLDGILAFLLQGLGVFFLVVMLQFFRKPKRTPVVQDGTILCPADGKVVVIEEVTEGEYFKDKRIQISIFMSPINVHINWFPISGKILYSKYHPGKFLVAWDPKSSTDNERTTIVVEEDKKRSILFKQIAGAMARRIVNYSVIGNEAKQGDEFGFIKFGSRIDVLLPLGTTINVELDQNVVGTQTVIATLN